MNILFNRERLVLLLGFYVLHFCLKTDAKCRNGCPLAMASYYVWEGSNLTYISKLFGREIAEILSYNRKVVSDPDNIPSNIRINIPISCECMNGDFLGHTFLYTTQAGDTYDKVATLAFANLTTGYWLQRVNTYDPTRIPDLAPMNVTVNCSCGDGHVSKDYGLFTTYPLRPGDGLWSVVAESGVPPKLLERFNPDSDFGAGSGLVFVPAKGQ